MPSSAKLMAAACDFGPGTTLGNADFGFITGAGRARSMQLGLTEFATEGK